MRKLTRQIGLALLCAAFTIGSCDKRTEEQTVMESPSKIGSMNRPLIVDGMNVVSDMYGCIIRFPNSPQGWMRTCVYQNKVYVEMHSQMAGILKPVIYDYPIDSSEGGEYKRRHDEDTLLIKNANR